MKYEITLGLGHTTNSSSCIHFFPKEILKHPLLASFLERYEISGGFVGEDLWMRSTCDSILLTEDQKEEADKDLNSLEGSPSVVGNPGEFVVIYGDEYSGIAQIFAEMCEDVCKELGLEHSSTEYN